MSSIEIQKTQFKISDFVSWQTNGILDLSPEFQRRAVWNKNAKSFLMDTIVNGYPVPIIFIREKYTNDTSIHPSREIVDGQQRLRTILAYISKELLGKEYLAEIDEFTISKAHNKDLAGKSFKGLPTSIKRKILDYEFSTHVLSADVSDEKVLQIFSRMNSTGVKLKPQELRNAEYFGVFKSSVYNLSLSKLDFWRRWKILSSRDLARMEEAELTSDLYNLIINGIVTKDKKTIDNLYEVLDEDFETVEEVEHRFEKVIDQLDDVFDPKIHTSKFCLKNMFYILFAYAYEEMYGIGSNLGSDIKPKKLTKKFVSSVYKVDTFLRNNDNLANPDPQYTSRRVSTATSRNKFITLFKDLRDE